MYHVFGLSTIFLTRVFNALSLTYPEGEGYFTQSVRPFRSAIQDADLAQRVDDFVSYLSGHFEHILKHHSPQFNLALTAASEYLTGLMADTFFKQGDFRPCTSLCSCFICMACH